MYNIIHHMWTKSTLFLLQKQGRDSYLFKYAILSLIGVPITPGFVAKMLSLYYMINHQYYFFAFILICATVITGCSMEKFMNQKACVEIMSSSHKKLQDDVSLSNRTGEHCMQYDSFVSDRSFIQKIICSISLFICFILMIFVYNISA